MPEIEERVRPKKFIPTDEMRRRAAAETDRTVREQMAREAEARSAKMARLREERLAAQTEATDRGPRGKPAKPRARRIVVR